MEGELDRRTFLRGMLKTAVIGAVATPALAELLTPKRTIFLPPRSGWLDNTTGQTATAQEIYDDITRLFKQMQRQGEEGWPADREFNAGVPQFLTNYVDPKVVEILVKPVRHAQLTRLFYG